MNIGNMIGAFIVVVVGLILAPMVGSMTRDVGYDWNGTAWVRDANITSGLTTLVDLVPFMWIIAIIGVAVALGYKAFKN